MSGFLRWTSRIPSRFHSATDCSLATRRLLPSQRCSLYRYQAPRCFQHFRSLSHKHNRPADGPEECQANPPSPALRDAPTQDNSLLAPVHIPENPNAILKEQHPASRILANSGLVVQRELELMNVLVGFEQANKYVILDAQGHHIGYIAEQESGMMKMMGRQWFGTHRPFVTHVLDKDQTEVLRFDRPFSWVNSRIRVYDPIGSTSAHKSTHPPVLSAESGNPLSPIEPMPIVGEAHRQWAPLRRKYNLFAYDNNQTPERYHQATSSIDPTASQPDGNLTQFASVDEPFLSWDFSLRSADNRVLGSVNRDFAGFAREVFTDTGVYALRMDSASLAEERTRKHLISHTQQTYNTDTRGMTLDQRAVMLATAVSIDFDYFSRHSSGYGGVMAAPVFDSYVSGGATTAGATEAVGTAGAAAGAGAVVGGAQAISAGTPVARPGQPADPDDSSSNHQPVDSAPDTQSEPGAFEEKPWWEMEDQQPREGVSHSDQPFAEENEDDDWWFGGGDEGGGGGDAF